MECLSSDKRTSLFTIQNCFRASSPVGNQINEFLAKFIHIFCQIDRINTVNIFLNAAKRSSLQDNICEIAQMLVIGLAPGANALNILKS